jgi:hypothetical protein
VVVIAVVIFACGIPKSTCFGCAAGETHYHPMYLMKNMLNINRSSILLSSWSRFDGETVVLSHFCIWHSKIHLFWLCSRRNSLPSHVLDDKHVQYQSMVNIGQWLLSSWSRFDGETVVLSHFACGIPKSSCFCCAAGETHYHPMCMLHNKIHLSILI